MIEFTDITLRQAEGSFDITNDIMKVKEWMIRTKAFIRTETISCFFILHLFSNKRVVIQETEHPVVIDVPEDDFRYLHDWTVKNGWDGPYVAERLLVERRAHDFWLRLYRSGIIKSDLLNEIEKDEIARFSKIKTIDDPEV